VAFFLLLVSPSCTKQEETQVSPIVTKNNRGNKSSNNTIVNALVSNTNFRDARIASRAIEQLFETAISNGIANGNYNPELALASSTTQADSLQAFGVLPSAFNTQFYLMEQATLKLKTDMPILSTLSKAEFTLVFDEAVKIVDEQDRYETQNLYCRIMYAGCRVAALATYVYDIITEHPLAGAIYTLSVIRCGLGYYACVLS
jgi:hypothetical protein